MTTLSAGNRTRVFAVLLSGSCISSFIQTALNTALTPIMIEMQISAGTVQWLNSIYSLVMGIMVLATPFLIKRFPCRHLYVVSMGTFCLGLLLSAAAPIFSMLLAGRVLQAVGCGVLSSLTQVVILSVYPPEKRGSMMGVYGLAVCTLPVLAPTLSGIIIDLYSWQMIFWVTLVISLMVLGAGTLFMRNFAPQEKLSFDTLSMSLCSCGFLGLVLGLGNWGTYPFVSLQVLLPIVVGCLALAMFVRRQLQMETPFLNLSIFSDSNFRISVIASVLLYSGLIATSILIPLYLQSLREVSATVSGLVTMPGSLITAISSIVAGKLYDRIGIRKLYLVGTFLICIGCISFCFLSEVTPLSVVTALYAFRSIGVGMLLMTTVNWGMSTIASRHTADGTAILGSLRTIAGAVGSAVFVSLMTAVSSKSGAGSAVTLVGIQAAFAGVAVTSIILLPLAIQKIGKPDRAPTPSQAPVK